ncbi:MAG TPA: DUF4215 domain-containing protein [Kofleriaceae bacterium]|nr:DUF4215 domain-containing protein [Kofleriaceae bacterium]
MVSTVRGVALAVLSAVFVLVAGSGCGDNLVPEQEPDAFVPPAACGNGVVDPGEDCDDGNVMPDNACDARCLFTCGNGTVDDTFGELCDTGIVSGAGACPSTCNDGMACTQDALAGGGCQAECVTAPITTPINGDGCCPSGGNSTNDNDCQVACGNGVVETGELCDTAIATGNGACPTVASCADGMNCTTDAVGGAGCQAMCTHTNITQTIPSDGCCPPGATTATDNDCVAGCGNGVVDSGETCDTAITVGVGRCPVSCTDGVACTRDVLSGGGSCTAACSFPAITAPANNDGCCPAGVGANNNNDSDCPPVCRNGVVEQGEQCDDNNNVDTDACNNNCQLNTVAGTAFRMSDLDLRDPHVHVSAVFCFDVTDNPVAGFAVNAELQSSIQNDEDNPADGQLDLNIAAVFRPLNQTGGATTGLEIHFPSCTSPMASTTCSRNPPASAAITAMATNTASGTCLSPLANTTTGPYTPEITNATGPCYLSDEVTVTINVANIPITLRNARIAATYVGNPASTTINGLLRGFISETDADNTVLPMSLPVVGGRPLSSVLPGGDPPGPGNTNCAGHSDVDINNGVRGWWFYLNFSAPRVPWVDN